MSVCVAKHRDVPWPGPIPAWAVASKCKIISTVISTRKQPPWLTWPAQAVGPTSPWHTGDTHSMASWATIRLLPALAEPLYQQAGAKSWCCF